MGLFNEDQVRRLNGMGIQAEINKDYTPEERKNMAFKVTDYIFSHSTKNNDIRNLQIENADIISKL